MMMGSMSSAIWLGVAHFDADELLLAQGANYWDSALIPVGRAVSRSPKESCCSPNMNSKVLRAASNLPVI